MKITSIKNLQVSGVYSILSVLMGMTGLIAVLSIVVPAVTAIIGETLPAWYGLPVSLELPFSEVKRVASENYTIFPIRGELTIFHSNALNSFLYSLIPILVFTSATYAIYLLRKFFKNIYEGKFFATENKRVMYMLGTLCIIIPPIIKMIQKAILVALPKDLIVDGMKVLPPQGMGFMQNFFSEYLILGLFLIILADVFSEGKKLKEENDLTV